MSDDVTTSHGKVPKGFPNGKHCPLCRGGINEWGHTRPCHAVQEALATLRAENARLRAVVDLIRTYVNDIGDPTLYVALAALDSQETGSRGSGTADSVLTDEGGEG